MFFGFLALVWNRALRRRQSNTQASATPRLFAHPQLRLFLLCHMPTRMPEEAHRIKRSTSHRRASVIQKRRARHNSLDRVSRKHTCRSEVSHRRR